MCRWTAAAGNSRAGPPQACSGANAGGGPHGRSLRLRCRSKRAGPQATLPDVPHADPQNGHHTSATHRPHLGAQHLADSGQLWPNPATLWRKLANTAHQPSRWADIGDNLLNYGASKRYKAWDRRVPHHTGAKCIWAPTLRQDNPERAGVFGIRRTPSGVGEEEEGEEKEERRRREAQREKRRTRQNQTRRRGKSCRTTAHRPTLAEFGPTLLSWGIC